jgi:hypothetical protein
MSDDYGVAGAGNGGNRVSALKGITAKFIKPKEAGALVFDIIQRPDNTLAYAYRVHKNVGPGKHEIVCPRCMGLPCPICDMQKKVADQMEAEGKLNVWKTKEVKAFFPQDRVIYNVVNVGDRASGIQLIDASDFKFHKPLLAAAATHKQVRALTRFPYASPTEGSSVVATIVMDKAILGGKEQTFASWSSFSFMERTQQYPADIINQVVLVEKFLNLLSYDAIERLLFGAPEPEQEEFQDDIPEIGQSLAHVEVPKPVETTSAAPQAIGIPSMSNNHTAASGPVCEFEGRFGVDFNKLPECATKCNSFLECRTAKNARSADMPL